MVKVGFQHMGDSEDSLEAQLGPFAGNPFSPLTDLWAVHDSVLGVLRLFGGPLKEEYTPDEIQSFRYHFDFIGAVMDMEIVDILEVFGRAAVEKVKHPVQITYMLCGED